MIKKYKVIIGLSLISLGVFLQILWFVFCLSFIFVGVFLLIFAPGLLFLPFNFFFTLGMGVIRDYFESSGSGRYRRYNYRRYDNYQRSRQHGQRSGYTPAFDITDKYYKILESNKNDSFETIKKNYRRLIKKYHYDTIISKNPTQEEIKEAEKKTQELNEAYTKIKEIYKNRA